MNVIKMFVAAQCVAFWVRKCPHDWKVASLNPMVCRDFTAGPLSLKYSRDQSILLYQLFGWNYLQNLLHK